MLRMFKGGSQLVKDPEANIEWFKFDKLGKSWSS